MELKFPEEKNISLLMFFDIYEILQIDSKNRDLAQIGYSLQKSKRSIINNNFNLSTEYDCQLYDKSIGHIAVANSDNWLISHYDSTKYD